MLGNLVPKFKMTREQLSFQKRFEKIQKIRTALRVRMSAAMDEMATIRELFQMTENEAKALVPPSQGIRTLPEMDEDKPNTTESQEQMQMSQTS